MKILNMIFNMSVIGSIMFFIFLFLKPITKKQFNSSWHYKMLILILTFFIIPADNFIKLPTIFSMANISNLEIGESRATENIKTKEETDIIEKNINLEKGVSENAVEVVDKVKDENVNQIKTTNQDFQNIESNLNNYKHMIKYIWIIGVIALLLLRIIPYIRFKSLVLRDSKVVEEDDIVNIFNLCKDMLNLNTKIQLRYCDNVGSPMLVGIFNPMVIIPRIDEDYKRLKMIFLHELHHFKRKDIILKAFGLIISAIHWFNPLSFILLKEMDKYCEYSIDEKVVEEMDINDRKYYGETILSLISSSRFKKSSLTTAMGSSGKQLKIRLENMVYSFKITRKKQIMSLIVAILILISGFTVACGVLPDNTSEENNSLVAYIKEDGLYYSHLNDGNEIKIHEGNGFEYPLISSEGNYIAYTKEDSIFIYSMKDKSYEKIDDEIDHYYMAYDWIDDETIIFGSVGEAGFTIFNVISKERTEHLDEYYYTGLIASDDNKVYGTKYNRWTTAEGDFISNDGIVEIELNNYDVNKKQFATNIIIEGRKSTDEAIGYDPIVWDISADGRYIYIMEKPASGSLSSDGITIGIFDVKERTHTKFADIDALSYKNHLTINPKNNMIGLIEGAGRDMFENKNVITLDMYTEKSTDISSINRITDGGFVAMTPSFSLDGKKLLYSATEAMNPNTISDYNQIYNEWEKQPYSIYEYDLEGFKVRKVTEGNNFDFMPMDISNNEILFIRYKGNDYYSLIKLTNGKESVVADNIMFSGGEDNQPFGYYGHIDTEKGMDIFINKSNKSDKENDITNTKLFEGNSLAEDGVEEKDHLTSQLLKNKTEYVGDNSKVGGIISLLTFPENTAYDSFELSTDSEPFAISINLKTDTETRDFYSGEANQLQFQHNAMIMFALIGNVENIDFSLDDGLFPYSIQYTRGWANYQQYGKDVRDFAKSKEEFSKLINGTSGIGKNEDIKKLVEDNLSVILSSPKESSNPLDYINAHQNEYENFFKYGGEEALQYMLTQFEVGNTEDLRGQIMMQLCKELLGERNNVTDESLSPQEWYNALDVRLEILLPNFEYDGGDPIEKLVYDTEIEMDSASNQRGGFIMVASKIFGSYEEEDLLKVFVTTYSARYKLYGNALSDEGGGIIPAAITYRKNDNGRYVLEKYEQARDGTYFGPSIREYCTMPVSGKEIEGLADEIFNHYRDYEDILILQYENLYKHLKKNGIADATITNYLGEVKFSMNDPKYKP